MDEEISRGLMHLKVVFTLIKPNLPTLQHKKEETQKGALNACLPSGSWLIGGLQPPASLFFLRGERENMVGWGSYMNTKS